jgi:hypothetical protein
VCRDTHIVNALAVPMQGCVCLSEERELPALSLVMHSALSTKRLRLHSDLNDYCMDGYECHDINRAKELLRSYACSIYDQLKDFYTGKIPTWQWEIEIAEQSIGIVLKCWDNFNASPDSIISEEALFRTISQHAGYTLRSSAQRTESPLPSSPLTAKTKGSTAKRREQLLNEYKNKTGASNKKIYESSNSGIHKPQFYEWVRGTLPDSSTTTVNFERFLREQKPPRPRKS